MANITLKTDSTRSNITQTRAASLDYQSPIDAAVGKNRVVRAFRIGEETISAMGALIGKTKQASATIRVNEILADAGKHYSNLAITLDEGVSNVPAEKLELGNVLKDYDGDGFKVNEDTISEYDPGEISPLVADKVKSQLQILSTRHREKIAFATIAALKKKDSWYIKDQTLEAINNVQLVILGGQYKPNEHNNGISYKKYEEQFSTLRKMLHERILFDSMSKEDRSDILNEFSQQYMNLQFVTDLANDPEKTFKEVKTGKYNVKGELFHPRYWAHLVNADSQRKQTGLKADKAQEKRDRKQGEKQIQAEKEKTDLDFLEKFAIDPKDANWVWTKIVSFDNERGVALYNPDHGIKALKKLNHHDASRVILQIQIRFPLMDGISDAEFNHIKTRYENWILGDLRGNQQTDFLYFKNGEISIDGGPKYKISGEHSDILGPLYEWKIEAHRNNQ